MIARNHWKAGLGAWLLVGAGATFLGAPAALVLGLGPVAASGSLGPDLDKPPEGDKPGATAVEAHSIASHALSQLVASVSGGHRSRRHLWSTHRYSCAVLVGLAVAALAWRWPRETTLALTAWWGAWPLYCSMPYRIRWSAAAIAAVTAVAADALGWLPATPWVGVAAAFGWAAHIFCDRLQSAAFELGGLAETVTAWAVLAAGVGLTLVLLFPTQLSPLS